MPLRVSMLAGWPSCTSLACVSGTRMTAFSRSGCATRARFVPGVDPLADLDADLLQHAGDARPHLEGEELAAAQARQRAPLLDLRRLHRRAAP